MSLPPPKCWYSPPFNLPGLAAGWPEPAPPARPPPDPCPRRCSRSGTGMGRWWEWDGDGGGLPKTGGVGGSHPITPYPAALPHSPAASWRCRGVRGSRRSRGGRRGQGDPVGGRLGGVCVCQWDKGGGTNATMEVFRGTPPPKPILTLSPGSPGAPGGPCVPGGPDMPWGGGGRQTRDMG